MNIQTIRNLLLIGILAFAFNGKIQLSASSAVSVCPVQSVLEQQDVHFGKAQKFHLFTEELRIGALANLNAPVQESSASIRRVEYSRSEESADGANAATFFTSTSAHRVQAIAVNDRHGISALCHNSRYYINKFGTLLI